MCKVQLVPIALPADNPQQSEEASHISPKGNHGRQKCKVGGTAVEKASAEGFDALHKVCIASGNLNAVQMIHINLT
jgi:hypothetical protein